ncbi:unnamed protein product [Trichogramma brassicae]|uniref:Uncharacterized protein n=1 Tax=Trichogramma brassicae TaxID=86971 RepID=A0A6H5HV69_9HYME|nr:unnamed protein product [Trichogramma brassicae]
MALDIQRRHAPSVEAGNENGVSRRGRYDSRHTDNRTSLIASDEQKREAHHQAESPSTVSDNQPLDAKIVVESIRDVPPRVVCRADRPYVIDANANVANQLVESPDKDNNQINIVENESSENAELCSTALSDRDDTNLHARWWRESLS